MRKQNRKFIILSLIPPIFCFVLWVVYPTIRCITQSFFAMNNLTDPVSKWEFIGFNNYKELFNSPVFMVSFKTIGKIWLYGGLITMACSLLFATILTSGVLFKSFWRSLIYLPNTISAVAMVNMWSLYIYNNSFGMLHKIFTKLGMEQLAAINWTDSDHMFGSMLVAYCFGYIGYLMLIFIAAMDGIPVDLYESAYLDGANSWVRFWRITMPLIRETFRTCLTYWTLGTIGFFIWSQLWSRVDDLSLMTPALYMYNTTFATSSTDVLQKNIGRGCAVAVIMMLMALFAHLLFNVVLKERKYEY